MSTHGSGSVRSFFLRALCLLAGVFCATGQAQASNYGCQVLLCLANPQGPTAVGQCVPPISQLWKDLAKHKPFPSCETASANGNSAYAKQVETYYDDCPAGLVPLAKGQYALQSDYVSEDPRQGIGSGDDARPDELNGVYLGVKVCVGQPMGSVTIWMGEPDGGPYLKPMGQVGYQDVGLYDRVAFITPSQWPQAIDVYINGSLFRRVRYLGN